jgi:hypothetical protein
MHSKRKRVKKQHLDEVSSGEPMASGRGGIGIDNIEVPADQMSRANRGRVETEIEELKKEKESPRKSLSRPKSLKRKASSKTTSQLRHKRS